MSLCRRHCELGLYTRDNFRASCVATKLQDEVLVSERTLPYSLSLLWPKVHTNDITTKEGRYAGFVYSVNILTYNSNITKEKLIFLSCHYVTKLGLRRRLRNEFSVS